MPGPCDNFLRELTPRQVGWLPLDEAGNPTGPATVAPPNYQGARACSVMANPSYDELNKDSHALLTASGANLEPPLESNVDKRDQDSLPPDPPPTEPPPEP